MENIDLPSIVYLPDTDTLRIYWNDPSKTNADLSLFIDDHNYITGCQINNIQSLIRFQSGEIFRLKLSSLFPIYERLIHSRFPSVKLVILPSPAPPGESDPYGFHAFNVPNDQLRVFIKFVIDDLPNLLSLEGVTDSYADTIMPHSVFQTQKYYSEFA